jgi:hypothetical protein
MFIFQSVSGLRKVLLFCDSFADKLEIYWIYHWCDWLLSFISIKFWLMDYCTIFIYLWSPCSKNTTQHISLWHLEYILLCLSIQYARSRFLNNVCFLKLIKSSGDIFTPQTQRKTHIGIFFVSCPSFLGHRLITANFVMCLRFGEKEYESAA